MLVMTNTKDHPTALPARARTVVVGAGYAGLSAALSLHDDGIDTLILEGSDRVGGRVCSERRKDGVVVDHGGQWVGPTQKHLLALAERFDCPTFPTYNTGEHLELWPDGVQRRYTGAGPDNGPGMADYLAAADRIDELARTVDLDDPTATPGIERWDSETVHSYFERTVANEDARRRLALAVEGVWSIEPRDLSVFHLMFYVASAGGFDQLMETEGCAQERRFRDGAQSTALAVADHLGDRVHVNTAVCHVEHTTDGVRIETTRGTILADGVVMALPPSATQHVTFTPPLPVARTRWVDRSPMGDVAKVHAVFDTPFWRADGLSGQATIYGNRAVGVVFDNSPENAGHGVLVCFVYGDRQRSWSALSDDDRRAAIIATLVELFGDRAASPIDYTEKIWPQDVWARGGYAASPTPGTWFAHGHDGWRAPADRIHWAGSETASIWNGYIDGAISSGARAAEEIRKQLSR
ncbi:flavin monoamine oxidase family protein [Rhodococcus koreensis]